MMRTAISPRLAIRIRGFATRPAPSCLLDRTVGLPRVRGTRYPPNNRVPPNGSQTSGAVRGRPGAGARTRGCACTRAVRRGYCLDPGDGPRAGDRRHARVDPRRRRPSDRGPRPPGAHVARPAGPGADVLVRAATRPRPRLRRAADVAGRYGDGAGPPT